jgi:hypothetical protein
MKSYNYLNRLLAYQTMITIKASYNRMVQYLQLISNTIAYLLDVWTPSDSFIKPQIADQVALGYFKNFKDDMYSLK